jgi:hypothetical protein
MAEDRDLERAKMLREDAHRAHDANKEAATAMNEAAVNTGQLVARTLVLINGGAAAAILAFLASIISQGRATVAQADPIAGIRRGLCCPKLRVGIPDQSDGGVSANIAEPNFRVSILHRRAKHR